LFRLFPNDSSLNFDYSSLHSKTPAVRVTDCSNGSFKESVICPPCFKHDEHEVIEVQDILNASSSSGGFSRYYSSFAKLEDGPSIQSLFDVMQFPDSLNFKKDILFEHAFISNFDSDVLTAQAHGNSITSSMAVQFVGKKVWLFFSPEIFRGKDYLKSIPGTGKQNLALL
jgi:hypothetical protein